MTGQLTRDQATRLARERGGAAATPEMGRRMVSWLPDDPLVDLPPSDEWPTAHVTWWAPPDPHALTPAMCDAFLALARDVAPAPPGPGRGRQEWRCTSYALPPDRIASEAGQAWGHVAQLAALANACWWRLDLTDMVVEVKDYGTGAEHPLHTDLHVGQARRKLALLAQLSVPDSYGGGDLVVYSYPTKEQLTAPRARGTVVAVPGWAPHGVEPVLWGHRWSLVVWCYGPPVR